MIDSSGKQNGVPGKTSKRENDNDREDGDKDQTTSGPDGPQSVQFKKSPPCYCNMNKRKLPGDDDKDDEEGDKKKSAALAKDKKTPDKKPKKDDERQTNEDVAEPEAKKIKEYKKSCPCKGKYRAPFLFPTTPLPPPRSTHDNSF